MINKIIEKFKTAEHKVLLLFDENGDYQEELLAYTGDAFRVITVANNYFYIKYEVERTDRTDHLLLYHRFAQPKEEEFINYPLANLLMAGCLLAVDEVSELIAELAILPQHRACIEPLKRWIIPKKYKNKLLPILHPFSEEVLQQAVISIIIEEKIIGKNLHNAIRIFEIINEGETAWAKKQEQLQKVGLDSTLQRQLYSLLGISVPDISFHTLRGLFLQLKYNAITTHIQELNPKDDYAKLKITDLVTKIKIDNFFREWKEHKTKSQILQKLLENLGSEVQLGKIIATYDIAIEYGLMANQIMALKLEAVLQQLAVVPSEVIEQYASWENNADEYTDYQFQMNFILNTAHFYELKNQYRDFIFNNADEYIEIYSKELYRLDAYYRNAFIAYQEMKEEASEGYAQVFSALNKAYDQYLIELNTPWVKEMNEREFKVKDLKITKQYDFYKKYITPITTVKKVVIISDAFRYELAQQLAELLGADVKNKVSCQAMLSAIPSYTNLGMAQLLPNDKIEAVISEDKIDYAIEGIKTMSSNRTKILQSVEQQSEVVDFASFDKFDKESGRVFFRNKQTVYIYHNWMDAIGDKKTSEYYTFESSKQCIEQLYKAVKRLYDSYNIGQVFITADHGFLFNYEEISAATSQPFPEVTQLLKEHNRFCITGKKENNLKDSYQFPLAHTTNIGTEAQVIIPKSINRFRKQGNIGKQFVHGGVSLQEVIIPVLELKRTKNPNAEEVPFSLMEFPNNISSSTIRLKFLQEEPIGGNYKPMEITIGIYSKDGELISTETNVEFDQTSTTPTDRVYEVKLEMLSIASKQSIGYIKIYKSKDKEKLNAIFEKMIEIKILELDDF